MNATDPEQERRLLDQLGRLLDADPDTRAAELARLRAQDPATADRLQRWLTTAEAPATLTAHDAPPTGGKGRPGEQLGPYELLEPLGIGGMGEVWRARRADGAYARHVAVKRVFGGGRLASRFQRERQVLAQLQHPHIAQLLDAGVDRDGQAWFALELVRGESITHWCDSRTASLEQRVNVFVQLCDAVGFAHANLVVHRDLKPANVLVDGAGNVKLLDFGIARLLDDADADQTQTLAMTPAWATPEQRRGEPITTVSDVYQLGLLLRQLLTGLPPTTHAALRASVAFEHWRRDDASAAEAAAQARGLHAQALQSRLRGDLDSIIALATAERASERYSSAQALAQDLQRWLRHAPVHARGDDRGYRARRWAQRWWPALAGALVIVALGLYHMHAQRSALSATRAALARAVAAERQAVEQRQRANRQRDRARNVANYFERLFETASARDIDRGDISARQLLERSVAALERDRHTPPATRAQLLVAAASALGQLNRSEEALQIHRRAITLLEAMPQRDADATASAYAALATRLNATGRYDEARAALQRGQAQFANHGADDPVARVQLEQLAGLLAQRQGDAKNARAAYERIVQLTGQDPDEYELVRSGISARVNLAQLETNPAAAEAQLKRGLQLLERHPGEHAELDFPLRMNLSAALLRQDKTAAASTLIERTLADAREYFTEGDPWLGVLLVTAGKIDRSTGHPQRAEERIHTGMTVLQQALGADNPVAWHARRELVFTQLAAGHISAAQPHLRAWMAASPGDRNPEDAAALALVQAILACRADPRVPTQRQLAQGVAKAETAGPRSKELARLTDWVAACQATRGVQP